MSAKQIVKDTARDLGVDETVQVLCPFCKEDWEMERRPMYWKPNRSCSITRTNLGILYNCYRASCQRGHGFIPTVYVDSSETKKVSKPKIRTYPCSTRELTDEEQEYLTKKFEFSAETIKDAGIIYSPERSSYIFPIRTWNGYNVGVVDRDFHNQRDLKAITYWFNDVPKLYFTPVQGDTVIIVEDIPSAIKVSKFVPAIALMGTSLGDKEVNLIRKFYSKIIIALDNDAISKAVSLTRKYGFYFKTCTLLPLLKDIKDMKYEDIKNLIQPTE